MLERLGRAMDLPPIRAHVYEIAPVNGLAAPDGRIFLTRGFLDRLDSILPSAAVAYAFFLIFS